MKVTVNGDVLTLPDHSTVADLIRHLELTGRRLAVEVNQEIVPRSQHDQHQLQASDTVEVVHAIGGG